MPRHRTWDALAGLLAATVALGVGDLAAALAGVSSLVISVANIVVYLTPGSVVKQAIEALGRNDKPFLLLTVTAASLVIGALLGPVVARRPRVGEAAFIAFGLLGFAAAMREPTTSLTIAALVATVAAVAGYATLRVLLGAAAPDFTEAGALPMPGRGTAGRRRFLGFAATAAGGAAASAFTGRFLVGPAVDVEAQRQAIVFPPVDGRFASSRAGLDVPGIATLVTPNKDFYRIDTALTVPRIDAGTWRLRIKGMVDRPYELTFAELLEMAAVEESITLTCVSNEVGGDLVGNAIWRGVPLAEILKRAGVQPNASQIIGRSHDGFTVGFPTAVALDGRMSMVAVGMNGEPLPADHGFPARLVIPGLYGYVSATKWLTEIELTRLEAYDAYWIQRGWDKEAPILTQSRIDVPRRGQALAPGRRAIAGVAWAGDRSISAVEVRVGPEFKASAGKWIPARLSESLSGTSWRQWVVEWDAQPGTYQLQVRATDGKGAPQTDIEAPPGPNGATGYHTITVTVRA